MADRGGLWTLAVFSVETEILTLCNFKISKSYN